MSPGPTTLIAGIGSAYGDDRVGWEIVRRLTGRLPSSAAAVSLASPMDLLDRTTGIRRLIVCDACDGAEPVGTILRLRWPDERLRERRFGGTHDADLPTVLRLAERLGRLPPEVDVRGLRVAADHAGPASFDEPLSGDATQAVDFIVAELLRELSGARSLVG